jgi:hypothetical protein
MAQLFPSLVVKSDGIDWSERFQVGGNAAGAWMGS